MNISVKGDASQVQNYLRLYVTMSDVSEYSSLDQMRKQLMNEFMKTDNGQSFDLFSSSSESGVSQRVDNPVEESDEGFESDFEDLAEVDDFDVDDADDVDEVDEVRGPEEAWEKTFEVEDAEDVKNEESNIEEAEFYYDSDGFLTVKGTDLELEETSVEESSELENSEIEDSGDFEDVEEVVDEEEIVDDEGDFDDWGSWGDESEDEEINEEYVEEIDKEPEEVDEEVVEEAVETSSRFPTDKSAMGGLGYVRDTYKLDEVQSLPPMREFVKKNPQISKLEVIELYGSKEVQKQLKLGKVYERKGRLFI